jgi:hypothetical protein
MNEWSARLIGDDEDAEGYTIVELSNGKFLVLHYEDLEV